MGRGEQSEKKEADNYKTKCGSMKRDLPPHYESKKEGKYWKKKGGKAGEDRMGKDDVVGKPRRAEVVGGNNGYKQRESPEVSQKNA